MRPLVTLLSFALILAVLAGCTPSIQHWKSSELIGFRYDLDDAEYCAQFRFSENGKVTANLGQNGFATGTVYEWEIGHNGALLIKDVTGHVAFRFAKVSADRNRVEILSAGKKQVYVRKLM